MNGHLTSVTLNTGDTLGRCRSRHGSERNYRHQRRERHHQRHAWQVIHED
jgi:hypothetical protein